MQALLKEHKITDSDLLNSRHRKQHQREAKPVETENVENLNQKLYSYQNGVFYIDIVSECERMGDYIIND